MWDPGRSLWRPDVHDHVRSQDPRELTKTLVRRRRCRAVDTKSFEVLERHDAQLIRSDQAVQTLADERGERVTSRRAAGVTRDDRNANAHTFE